MDPGENCAALGLRISCTARSLADADSLSVAAFWADTVGTNCLEVDVLFIIVYMCFISPFLGCQDNAGRHLSQPVKGQYASQEDRP